MVKSGLRIKDVEVGERFWHCRYWLDHRDDFVEVQVAEKGRSRLKLVLLAGPKRGQEASAYASALWRDEQLPAVREYRRRDLAIRSLDQERPLDTVTQTAIEMCCVLLTDDISFEDEDVTRGLLRRLGRKDDLKELHELAYAEPDAAWPAVHAPADAWRSSTKHSPPPSRTSSTNAPMRPRSCSRTFPPGLAAKPSRCFDAGRASQRPVPWYRTRARRRTRSAGCAP